MDDMARHSGLVLVAPTFRRLSSWRLANRAEGETPSGKPAGCRRYGGMARRTIRAVAMSGFGNAHGKPQENSSLGTAVDPKLEASRPRAASSPRISGVLCVYW